MHPTRAFNASARDLPARTGSAPGPPARTRPARYRPARIGRMNALVQRNLRARANGRSKTGAAHTLSLIHIYLTERGLYGDYILASYSVSELEEAAAFMRCV